MASRRKKRALPPWLTGVDVSSKGQPVQRDETFTDGVQKAYAECVKPTSEKKVKSSCTDVAKEERETSLSAEQIVELSYPSYIFKGSIIYSYNKDDCNLLCDDLLSELDTSTDSFIGFDTEWPVSYEKGKQAKTALIQICPSVNKCYLFHISCMSGFPSMLRKLIETKTIKKVGLNVEYDFWKLDADYDIKAKEIIQTSAIELRSLANQQLKSAENWSLEGLTRNVLQLKISKDPNVRKCDWSQFPLPQEQQQYAATDAAVSLMLYQKLSKMGKTTVKL